MNSSVGSAVPAQKVAGHTRKQRILTHGTPSVTRGITDAIVLKDGDLFLVTEPNGSLPCGGEHGFGLYYHDCRYLRTYELLLDDLPPILLGSGAAEGYQCAVELTNPELRRPDGSDVPRDAVGIEWSRSLDGTAPALEDDITFRNWSHESVELGIRLRFGACFEDVFQIRGLLGERLGTSDPPSWEEGELRFRYHGIDHVDRSLIVTLPADLMPSGDVTATATVQLRPRAQRRFVLRLAIREDSTGTRPPAHASTSPDMPGAQTRPGGPWPGGIARLTSDSLALNDILARSFSDLRLLGSTIGSRTFIAAGIPWFATLFGRDSLMAALQLMPYCSSIAADTLRLLASYQGDRLDDWRDEAPGKILHELRVGEMARAGEIPHSPYYGTVDATPLFLIVLARYVSWTGDLDLFDELRDNVARALDWIDHYGDGDGDGYVEYRSVSEHGLINQGWKDSGNAIVDEEGNIATAPIALVEVQAYVYAAKLGIAELHDRRGERDDAERLRSEANDLKDRFNRDFWVEDLGFYALALEAGKQPLRVISSNPGHALWCGIATPDKARRVADRLTADDMYSGWGVRTLSSHSAGYTPIGYHLGTVWPHDNKLIAAGFRRYGFDAEASRIADGITGAAMDFEHDRLPELFTGFPKNHYGAPVRYPVACHPQAWAAGTLPFLMERLLGLEPSAPDGRLRIVRPVLPSFVNSVELENLKVGNASVHLRFRREKPDTGPTLVDVISVDGRLDVEVGSMATRLRSQVVVVTGASAGVGRAVAQAFARRGARLGLIARGAERLERAAKDVERLGGEALVLPGDVADEKRVFEVARRVEERFGSIDVWVNNAMVSVLSPAKQMLPKEYRRVTEVTYLGAVHGTLAALERMLPRDRGVIIQIGSALAYRGIPLQSAYCAAKHALQGFTESLRAELYHDGSRVRVTMLQLPAVDTPQFDWVRSRLPGRAQPVPPVFQPEVIADAVVWAAEHEREEMYLGLPTVKAIVGNRLLPRLLDHYLARTGYESQQTNEPEDPGRPDNLWQSVEGDFGAHGRFDSVALKKSRQIWLSEHRGTLALAAGVLALGLGLAKGRTNHG